MAESNNWQALEGKKVLLCEDHPINGEIVSSLLEKQGVTVILAENGKEGVQAFAGSQCGEFSAVIMDVNMPLMDGFEAARAIRALNRPDAPSVPIVAMSADDTAECKNKALSAGMTARFPKPVDARKLYDLLSELISPQG